jgi:hypothetical protein
MCGAVGGVGSAHEGGGAGCHGSIGSMEEAGEFTFKSPPETRSESKELCPRHG